MLETMSRDELVTIGVEFVRQTDMAVLVTDGDTEAWIPKRLIEDSGPDDEIWESMEAGDDMDITIPERFAIEKGLA
jgi:hypothetical protein